MSLHPDNAYCTRCGGVEPIGSFGRKLKSRCRCDDEAERSTVPYERMSIEERPDRSARVAA